jgi:hypothetical protein
MHTANKNIPIRTVFSLSRPDVAITNCAANFRLDPNNVNPLTGNACMFISLASADNSRLLAGVFYAPNRKLRLTLWHGTPERHVIAKPTELTTNDSFYLEIDVNPKNSQVTFWINERGMDMGVLSGFKGGANKVGWAAHASSAVHLPNCSFTDCALASKDGWLACDLGKADTNHANIQSYHSVELLSPNHISITNKRAVA